MKLRLLVFTCVGLLALAQLSAQAPAPGIKFDQSSHDFGQLDKGDPAEHTFSFTNVSDHPITLTRVKASCGCTTPSWTREEVAPGEAGEIKVKYNSARVGPFSKSITVNYSDSASRPIVLYIKGKVNNTQSALDQVYKRPLGNLAFDELVQTYGTIDSDKLKGTVFKMRNSGPKPITVSLKPEEYPELDVILSSTEILPGQVATLTVKAIGERFEEMGAFTRRVKLYTNDEAMPEKVLTVSGVLNKVFSEAELAKMPNIEFEVLEYDAGKVIAGEKVVYAYKFTNTGQDELVIESVKASCGCTATAPKDKLVKGGQASEIVATFDSRGRSGVQQKSITVRTNDPDQPTLVLRLRAEVESDPFHVGGAGPAEQQRRN